jgi:hypothetical protein
MMSTFLQDFRYAWRQLYKNRGVSLTAILSLTLGIGATVSVFSIIYAVLMNPWPYQGADRIASVALLDKWGHPQKGWRSSAYNFESATLVGSSPPRMLTVFQIGLQYLTNDGSSHEGVLL